MAINDCMSLFLQPKNYLDFITNYKRSLGNQRKEISDTSTRLSNGLSKLVQASAEVDQLQKELSQAKVVVEAATQECNQLLDVSVIIVHVLVGSTVQCSRSAVPGETSCLAAVRKTCLVYC